MFYYEEEMELFWRFIVKRHLIYKRKDLQGLPPPWTDDPILTNFKFTNVFRELDRGTKFVTNYIYRQGASKQDVVFNVIAYRLFNKIETFLHHNMLSLEKYDPIKFSKIIHELDHKQKVFTSAFIVSGYSMTELSGMDKISRLAKVFDWIRDQLLDEKQGILNAIYADTTMADTYHALRGLTGLGPFLAYQIAVDLSYWQVTKFGEDDFVIMGPGAKRGIDWLFSDESEHRDGRNYEECCFWLRDRQFKFFKDYDINYKQVFDDRSFPYLTVMALENLCCEFQKYMKATTGQGRPRNKYDVGEGRDRLEYYRSIEEWNTEPYDVFKKWANVIHYERLVKGDDI